MADIDLERVIRAIRVGYVGPTTQIQTAFPHVLGNSWDAIEARAAELERTHTSPLTPRGVRRNEIAAMAMQGMLANPDVVDVIHAIAGTNSISRAAFMIADAMMKEGGE
jgi:hypothetical protein